MMKKAVIFDFWNTLFKNKGKSPFEKLAERIGYSLDNYDYIKKVEKYLMLEKHEDVKGPLLKLLSELDINITDDLIRELESILKESGENVKPFPETIETLRYLKERYKVGLVTNTDYWGFNKLKNRYKLNDFFDKIVTSYEVNKVKPDPEIFRQVLKEFNVSKNEALMVGDSLRDDVKAAEEFGIEAVLIDRNGRYPNYPKRIESLKEIKKYI